MYLLIVFFFFKQKTAYEIMPSLVGSEMCIRDRCDIDWVQVYCSIRRRDGKKNRSTNVAEGRMSDRMMLTGSVFGSDVYIKRDDLQMKIVSFLLSYSIYVFWLLSADCSCRTCWFASATVNTCRSIDLHMICTHRDCSYWTFAFASSAAYTFVWNYVCHDMYPPYYYEKVKIDMPFA